MFTGIVHSTGHIVQVERKADDVRLRIDAPALEMADVAIGDSIAVNGVCLTATLVSAQGFEVHVSHETLQCTVGLEQARQVNLEKALRLSDRLGGHLVTGHVDGVGQVVRFESLGDCWLLMVRTPEPLLKYIAIKGSIAIDGVSLTINAIEKEVFSVNLIPHTLEVTTLHSLGVGSRVNLEIDLVARYVERLSQWQPDQLA